MAIRKYFFFLFFLLLSHIPALAQVEEAWVRRYNGPANDWDEPTAIAADDSGNVCVTGFSYGSSTSLDYATIKYSSNGVVLWVRRYDGATFRDEARALAVDQAGNVYVCGNSFGSFSTFHDYVTIKYDLMGDTVWVRRYDGGNGNDAARDVVVDNAGNVYVTGFSYGGGNYFNCVTIKYTPNGDTLWARLYNRDEPSSLAVDDSGNVYVTGYNLGDILTIKYSTTGDTFWVRRHDGIGNSNDKPTDLVVHNKNVYVTGVGRGLTSFDYTTIKYNSKGDTLWVRYYNGPADSNDVANALGVDDSGNVYVTGVSRGVSNSSDDLVTIKYSPNGDELWVRRFDGGNGWDGGRDLVLDKQGNVYVTGYSRSLTLEDFITIKYAPNGDILWKMRYNGPVDSNDVANAIAIDGSNNVYVTGRSIGSHTYQDHDYATIKYVQYACTAYSGDVNGDNGISLSDIITIINFLFKRQSAPDPLCRADVNADGRILLSDIVYLINFLGKSGPTPVKNKECCL